MTVVSGGFHVRLPRAACGVHARFSHGRLSLPHGWQPARLLCPWDSPGKNAGVGCHAPLYWIHPIQRPNQGILSLLHRGQLLYHLSHQGNLLMQHVKT